ncbi:MAG: ABC transporter ATP-binding protein [Chloroflexi bacterium]|nr:ABC transporter ATP-binding protein [Chloroflexota bacterium]
MLTLHSLSASYHNRLILDQLHLSISPGEALAVVGPNGAGKTTLVRAASGVMPPQRGRVLVDGEDLYRMNPMQRARYVAVAPQAKELPGMYTVYQTALLGRTPHLSWLGHASGEDHRLTRQALEQTELADLAERYVGELSGGEQQRVLLARALAQDTPILLLDEPTAHLDLHHRSHLLNLVRGQCKAKNLAVLMVLHDLNLASLYADQIVLLDGGKIAASGAPAEALTAATLSRVYGVPVQVIPHPQYGSPLVLPDGKNW